MRDQNSKGAPNHCCVFTGAKQHKTKSNEQKVLHKLDQSCLMPSTGQKTTRQQTAPEERTTPAATTFHPAGHNTDRCRSSPGPYQTGMDCPRRLWQLSHWTVLSPGSTRSCKHQLKAPSPHPPPAIPLPLTSPPLPPPSPPPTRFLCLRSLSTTTVTQIFATPSVIATESSTKWCWQLYGRRTILELMATRTCGKRAGLTSDFSFSRLVAISR